MNQEERLQFEQMKRDMADFKQWKEEKTRQQISFPLDQNSSDVLHQRLLKFANKSTSTITATSSIKVVIDGKSYQINVL